MKKQTLLLIAGSMLAFASCNNNTNMGGGFTQEQVDSIVNVRVAELQVAMQASNDSLINVLAQAKADSMIAAMKSTSTAPARTTKPAPKPAPAAKPAEPAKPAPNTPTGKNSQTQGQPTGKNSQNQQTGGQGQPTGKRR